jgi:hypothetical protein
VVGRERVGHLLIELAEVILDHAQFFQRELQQLTVNRMQRRVWKASHSCSGVARRRAVASVARATGSVRRPPAPAACGGH